MSDRSQDRWISSLRDLLTSDVAETGDAADADTQRATASSAGGTPTTQRQRYFCRTCGTTLDGHHGTCPDCGSRMLEPTQDYPVGGD
ncbi:hypothetical protein SAMN04487950_0722 [Halogranum rubrum]|uniref:Uncharacterized protein n=1 Tax=Halogranum rubrum TaxID=553466 RepID=A0A1I4BSX0_9EURY|nr:hypothetical protein [Halogranum rubrum]SFK71307.1 hypothetical protein SAMN04487950_0722 [Halogranum rubrum]